MTACRIDVHAHYLGGNVAELRASAGQPRSDAAWTPQATLAAMDQNEIATRFLSIPFTPLSAGREADFAQRFSRRVNEEYAELIQRYPGRFGAFASLPGDSSEAMLEELAYALDVLHLDGVSLNSNIAGQYLGAPLWEPLLAELSRRRVPVLIHPTDSPHAAELALGRHPSVIEFTFDTARTVTNAIYRGVFQRHPELTLILPHLGGPLPALAWRIAECTTISLGPDDAPITPEHVMEVLGSLYYDTALGGSPHGLAPALEVAGIGHILFGTDAPAAPQATVDRAVAELATSLTGDNLDAVERGNALRLFPRIT